MIGWIVVAITVISVCGTVMILRLLRNGQLQPRERKEENPTISRVSSSELMSTLYTRRRALKENLSGLRECQAELDREINNFSIETGIDHRGIPPELARKLTERAQLRSLVISAVEEIRRLDKHIDEVRGRVLSFKARRD